MRLESIKKFIGVLTALIVALSPMMVMASEATIDTNTQSGVSDEVVYSMETDYYDEDICVFVSCVNATMTGHLYFTYSYDEGVTANIHSSPKPRFYNVHVEGGNPKNGSYTAEVHGDVMYYKFAVSGENEARQIKFVVYVDEYGSVNYYVED